MAAVCTDLNLKITPGSPAVLGIEPWSAPRMVADQTFTSTGDGTIAATTTLPGKLMIDSGVMSWTNDSPLPCNILIRVGRGYRTLQTSNPNAIQVRDRWTVATGTKTPPVPDVSSSFQSQWGAGYDYGTYVNATPQPGVLWLAQDAHITEDWYPRLPAGKSFKIRYQAYAWTPPPFSNNGNSNNNLMSVEVRSTRIQLWAYPTQDTTVVTR